MDLQPGLWSIPATSDEGSTGDPATADTATGDPATADEGNPAELHEARGTTDAAVEGSSPAEPPAEALSSAATVGSEVSGPDGEPSADLAPSEAADQPEAADGDVPAPVGDESPPATPPAPGDARGRPDHRRLQWLLRTLLIVLLSFVLAIWLLYLSGFFAVPSGRPASVATPAMPSVATAAASLGASAAASPSPGASPSPAASGQPSAGAIKRISPQLAAELQRTLDAARKQYSMPGVGAAVLWPDGRLWTGSSGMADLSADRKVTSDTVFSIGSITKTFTAALVLQLVDQKVLSLDDTVARWLPDFRYGSGVTIRHLLDHTSGIYDFFASGTLDDALQSNKRRVWTPADVLKYVGPPVFAPGTGWDYSNTNYLLLGLIAERATGRSLDALFEERFFTPLGLHSTYLQGYGPSSGQVSHGYDFVNLSPQAPPIDWTDGTSFMPFTSVATAAWAAGGIASTPADLTRWARALYGGSVVSNQSLLDMVDVSEAERLGPSVAYGFGLQLMTLGARDTWGHSGRLGGYRTAMRYVPDQGVAVVVLTNQDRWDPDRIARALLDAAMPPIPGPRPKPM